MFKILPDTHKIVAKIVHDRIKEKYEINLNLEKMLWGSIAPDVLPYYKTKRHYFDESGDYIAREISKLIYFSRYSYSEGNESKLFINYISKKLGIIMHYLCDFVCYPHAYRMTFVDNFRKHVKYEQDLAIYARENKYLEEHFIDTIKSENINFFANIDQKLELKIKNYLVEVIKEYKSSNHSFDNDLNFALNLSTNISLLVIESILDYGEELDIQFI
ncbi:MAG: zinc dependent phospholipase C family protein [Peptoniphilus lacydonensis]|uniref:zinc dependent phospholipase C family protein n=1 Tax=Peptoniphilus TaxID=162289 RepID=UPI00028846C3|nr:MULTISPECIES: zinc dependent phospholipase C family protein [Peptoniphilus]MDU1043457.1 zinc dependent phospholipase C family protein [Peptoniphilus rhinitidis]MDU1954172.1 zinc dependent phospholipase C family protein [Peptoniphilus lacydonensis]MDU2115908.1 zinc dependent phospholipase C family protein [Peptoniphilus lacydonensis]MDU5274652.1 zinc dependent phospholipase C family protein [Peptoniphilus lacydonensis]